jgi:hypothetical protein
MTRSRRMPRSQAKPPRSAGCTGSSAKTMTQKSCRSSSLPRQRKALRSARCRRRKGRPRSSHGRRPSDADGGDASQAGLSGRSTARRLGFPPSVPVHPDRVLHGREARCDPEPAPVRAFGGGWLIRPERRVTIPQVRGRAVHEQAPHSGPVAAPVARARAPMAGGEADMGGRVARPARRLAQGRVGKDGSCGRPVLAPAPHTS